MSVKSYTFHVNKELHVSCYIHGKKIPSYQHCPVRNNIVVPRFIKYQHLKRYEDMELNIYTFLNSAFDANL
jgi:hypothetical protein